MRKPLAAAVAALSLPTVLAACATTTALAPASSQALKGASIAYVVHDRTEFRAMTVTKSFFAFNGGLIGGIAEQAGIDEGKRIRGDNAVTDPAPELAQSPAQDLASRYGARAATPVQAVDKAPYSRIANGAAYVLDVKTVGWSMGSFPFPHYGRYEVFYTAEATLADAHSDAVVVHAYCTGVWPHKAEEGVSYKEMLADGAARLKAATRQDVDACLGQLRMRLALG